MEDFHGHSFAHPLVENRDDACILSGLSFSYTHSRWGTDERPRWNRRAIPAAEARAEVLRAALRPLADIADAYDANELDDEARKSWGRRGEMQNTTPHDQIELYQGRGGRRLLTLADCFAARDALRGGAR